MINLNSDFNKIYEELSKLNEAKRISIGQGYGTKNANGEYTSTITQNTTMEEFAKSIGDVADAAKEEEGRIKYDEATRKAEANANSDAPGGKK